MIHASNTMWRIKNQPSNSTSYNDSALRLLVLVMGIYTEDFMWRHRFQFRVELGRVVLKDILYTFEGAKSCSKGIKDFSFEHCVNGVERDWEGTRPTLGYNIYVVLQYIQQLTWQKGRGYVILFDGIVREGASLKRWIGRSHFAHVEGGPSSINWSFFYESDIPRVCRLFHRKLLKKLAWSPSGHLPPLLSTLRNLRALVLTAFVNWLCVERVIREGEIITALIIQISVCGINFGNS